MISALAKVRDSWAGLALAAFGPPALIVLALLLFHQCSATRAATSALAVAEERAQLRAANQIVAEPVADLRPELDELTRENAALREALAAAQHAAPGSRPTAVVRAKAEPAPAQGTPTPSVQCPGASACVLAQGDELRLSVDEVVLATKAGNRVLVGTIAAERGGQQPTLLLRQPFSAPLTEAVAEQPEPPPGWGVGPWVAAGNGWAAGVAVASPSWRVPWLGWRVEASVGGGIGTGAMGAAAVLVRP